MSDDRYWVNWATETIVDITDVRGDKTTNGCVALVDEKHGGEIAYFMNEDHANNIASVLNAWEAIYND